MQSSWQTETGRLACRWSALGEPVSYRPTWMQEAAEVRVYLAPIPDFASHSPFGGVSWFQPNPADRDCE